jgi:hypothetical protein
MEGEGFRIPKIKVAVVCHTAYGETIRGDIFLDYLESDRYDTRQMLDFLNSPPPYIPVALESSQSVLLRKDCIVEFDVPGLLEEFRQETTSSYARRTEALIHSPLGATPSTVIIDLPLQSSRLLDLLNQDGPFFPAVVGDTLAFFNARQLYKIEEL